MWLYSVFRSTIVSSKAAVSKKLFSLSFELGQKQIGIYDTSMNSRESRSEDLLGAFTNSSDN
jgi:hypothetical protein